MILSVFFQDSWLSKGWEADKNIFKGDHLTSDQQRPGGRSGIEVIFRSDPLFFQLDPTGWFIGCEPIKKSDKRPRQEKRRHERRDRQANSWIVEESSKEILFKATVCYCEETRTCEQGWLRSHRVEVAWFWLALKRTGNAETLIDWLVFGLKYAGGERESRQHGQHASFLLFWLWQTHIWQVSEMSQGTSFSPPP